MKGNPLPISLSLLAALSVAAFAQVPDVPAPEAPAATEALTEPVTALSEPVTEPEAAPEPAPVAIPEPVAPVVEVAQTVAPVAPAVPEPSEPLSLKLGVHAGLGLSNFRGHAALRIVDFNGKETGSATKLDPAIGLSAGLALEISNLVSIFNLSPELNYTLYRSNTEVLSKKGGGMAEVHRMGVYMHALEIPVLIRFGFGPAYAEIGPQLGFNLYSAVYKNGDMWRPDMNVWNAGVAAGGGIKIMDRTSIGLRLYSGLREYSKDVEGIPFSAQLNINHFVF